MEDLKIFATVGDTEDTREARLFAKEEYQKAGIGGGGHALENEGATLVVIAKRSSEVVGTVSLTVDQGQLPGEHLFPVEIDELRRSEKHRFGSIWRLAVSDDEWCVHRALFTRSYELGIALMGVGRLIAVMHPRHAIFYRKTSGATLVAGPVEDATLNNAKASLITGRVEDMQKHWLGYLKSRALGLMDWHC